MRSILPLFAASLLSLPAVAAASEEEGLDPSTSSEPAESTEEAPAPVASSTTSSSAAAGGRGPRAGMVGLQFAIPSGGGRTMGATYFLNDHAAVRADLGIDLQFADGSTSAFSVEVGYRHYRKMTGNLATFLQPSLFVSEAANTVFALVGAIGAEWFLADNFAIGVATGLSVVVTSTDASTETRIVTGTSNAFASMYW